MPDLPDLPETSIRFWVLNELNEPVPATVLEWGAFRESDRRIIRQLRIGEVTVLTVFLGHDLDWELEQYERPLLFGTILRLDKYTYRNEVLSATYEEAIQAHEAAVQKLKDSLKDRQ